MRARLAIQQNQLQASRISNGLNLVALFNLVCRNNLVLYCDPEDTAYQHVCIYCQAVKYFPFKVPEPECTHEWMTVSKVDQELGSRYRAYQCVKCHIWETKILATWR